MRLTSRTGLQALDATIVVLLAAQTARLVWALVTPADPLGDPVSAAARAPLPSAPDFAVLERVASAARLTPTLPIVAVAAPAPPPPPPDPAQLGLRLHGVRGAMFGDRGSAIIATADGKQAAYGVGEQVVPGVRLSAVGSDRAVLTQGGARLVLRLGDAAAPPAAPAAPSPAFTPPAFVAPASPPPGGLRLPPPPASAPGAGASLGPDAAAFLAETALRPRMQDGRVNGVRLQTSRGGEAMRSLGLRSGDVLLSVNGQPLESRERIGELAEQLRASGGQAELRFERDGRVMTTRITPPGGRP